MSTKITSTADAILHGIKMLIYGLAGVGKTTLAKTCPGSVIIISAEAGLLSLRDCDIPVITVKSMSDVQQAYRFLREAKDGQQYDTIILDSISEIAEVVLAYEKKEHRDPRAAYGEMADDMISLVKAFRDLPGRHVIMTGKTERQKDDVSGVVMLTPSFPGAQLANKLPYLFDELFYMRVDKDGVRSLQTQGDHQIIAKDRSGALNPFEEPDLGKIFAKITERTDADA